MNNFLSAEASYLEAPEGIEPIIEDVEGGPYLCEAEGCENAATAELSWPMEDHDFEAGFFCQKCLDALEANNWEKP